MGLGKGRILQASALASKTVVDKVVKQVKSLRLPAFPSPFSQVLCSMLFFSLSPSQEII